jgi:hypothetical protein
MCILAYEGKNVEETTYLFKLMDEFIINFISRGINNAKLNSSPNANVLSLVKRRLKFLCCYINWWLFLFDIALLRILNLL